MMGDYHVRFGNEYFLREGYLISFETYLDTHNR